MLLYTIAS